VTYYNDGDSDFTLNLAMDVRDRAGEPAPQARTAKPRSAPPIDVTREVESYNWSTAR
jgi:hypothetical protein